MSQGFYEMLGVPAEATTEQLRAAYQRRLAELVRRLRAARKQGADVSILESQERELREAMDVLADAGRRRRYDAFRRAVSTELPTDAEGLWEGARWALVEPVAPLAVACLRALTDLPVGDPLPDPSLKLSAKPEPPPAAVVPLPGPRPPAPRLPLPPPGRTAAVVIAAPETAVGGLPDVDPGPQPLRVAPPVAAPPDRGTSPGRRPAEPEAPRTAPPPPLTAPVPPPRPAPPPVDDWLVDDESEEDLLPSVADVVAPARVPAVAHLRVDGRMVPVRVEEDDGDDASEGSGPASDWGSNYGSRSGAEADPLEPPLRVGPSLRMVPSAPPEPPLDEIGRIAKRHGLSGRFLREVRQHRGMTLDDLVRSTRISSRFLTAIEEDDFERLPNATFVRGYLKQVAEALQVADRGVVEGFMEQYKASRA